jgi:DHA1 family inner membrane transport protein
MLGILALGEHSIFITEIALFFWAAMVFAGCSALQINAVNLGKGAPNLISTLNIGAFNAGNALGAWVGGQVISHGFGLGAIAPAAAGLSLTALALTLLSLLPARRQLQSASL